MVCSEAFVSEEELRLPEFITRHILGFSSAFRSVHLGLRACDSGPQSIMKH